MARYTGPKSRIARKFGEAIFGADKVLSKKNYPPGQHGNNRRRKTSEYGIMLAEKQKAKYTYGVLEKQFRNLFERLQVHLVLPVKFCFRASKLALITLCSVWVLLQHVLLLVSW